MPPLFPINVANFFHLELAIKNNKHQSAAIIVKGKYYGAMRFEYVRLTERQLNLFRRHANPDRAVIVRSLAIPKHGSENTVNRPLIPPSIV